MAFKSPLRYPGGKTRAIRILETYIPPDKDEGFYELQFS
jgi:site-specific DNA-adenine methylase